MPDYEKLYHNMFNDVTDIIEKLKQSQIDAEEMYISMCEKEFDGGDDSEGENE